MVSEVQRIQNRSGLSSSQRTRLRPIGSYL